MSNLQKQSPEMDKKTVVQNVDSQKSVATSANSEPGAALSSKTFSPPGISKFEANTMKNVSPALEDITEESKSEPHSSHGSTKKLSTKKASLRTPYAQHGTYESSDKEGSVSSNSDEEEESDVH